MEKPVKAGREEGFVVDDVVLLEVEVE